MPADCYCTVPSSDDDTFVRVAPLSAYLSHLDHNKPHLIGGPVSSLQFLLEPHWELALSRCPVCVAWTVALP